MHVDRGGQRTSVVVLSDIDGTINDEAAPESQRLNSSQEVQVLFDELQAVGVPVGLLTSRSTLEAAIYEDFLHTTGPTLAEDGAVLSRPQFSLEHPDRHQLLAPETMTAIHRLLELMRDADPTSALVTSCGTSPEELYSLISYPSLDAAQAAVGRLASAYVFRCSQTQLDVANKQAAILGLRTYGGVNDIHLFGALNNKGTGLEWLNQNAAACLDDEIDGILPIVFGNSDNDVPMFDEAVQLGGFAVVMPDNDGRYAVNPHRLPHSTIKAPHPRAHGMRAVWELIWNELSTRTYHA